MCATGSLPLAARVIAQRLPALATMANGLRRCPWHTLVTAALFVTCGLRAEDAVPDAEKLKFFEQKVRPLLIDNCLKCHNEKKQKANLRMETLAGFLKGGDTGPAIVPGKPAESLLVKAVSYKDEDLFMPPKDKLTGDGGKMAAEDIATLTEWVQMGAPWTEGSSLAGEHKRRHITEADKKFWSFVPVKDAPPPAVTDAWVKNDIDKFIFAKLKAEEIAPSPEAEKAALIRRATYDLHGLPPTPEEVDAFVADTSPDAYEKLVDRLLASPRYGERWGRHWLDLVRFAESDGFKQDAFRPNAWPYRDYVIKAFNDDKPYDRFVTEQLAGDEIAPDDPDVLVATSYLRQSMYEYNQRDVPKQWSEYLNDITDVTGDVFLGLGMGCARCHDHKFDPILQSDYFQLQAFFSGILPRNDMVLATPKQKEEHAAKMKIWEEKTADIRAEIAAIEKPFLDRVAKPALSKFPPETREMIEKPADKRSPYECQIAELAYRQVTEEQRQIDGKIKGADREKWTAAKRKLAEFDDVKPKPLPPAFIATDVGPVGPPAIIPGDKKKRTFEPGFLTILGAEVPQISALPNSTGRRTALAKWITRPDNPLAARVMVNRIWQYHFGRGIASNTSDFGKLGEKPTHPELLDYLAANFVKNGWSIKKIHRLMMTSATYRQSGVQPTPAVAKLKDPDNRWLWRMTTRRLDAEQIRDAMLAVSGELSLDAGGPSVDFIAPRRGVFTKALRNTRDPFNEAFDGADGITTTPSRSTTTTPTQSLLLINGGWPLQRAENFAARLRNMKVKDNEQLVTQAYRLAFGRMPDAAERAAALKFLTRKSSETAPGAEPGGVMLSDKIVTEAMPHRGSQAIHVRNGNPEDMLRAADTPALPSEDFTVEAVVQLDSIYDDAKVRVIASQWSGNQAHTGWSFGVTSEKSKHEPRNLILQLVGKESYEVIPSDLRVELNKTFYLAVSVKLADTSAAGITFFLRDLTDPDAPLRTANVPHKTTGGYHSKLPLTIGGRDGHGWDGLIDEVRLSKAALTKEQILLNDPDLKTNVVADWRFDENPGVLKDSAGYQPDLTRGGPGKPQPPKANDNFLIDFCHVLLNANEFLYVE